MVKGIFFGMMFLGSGIINFLCSVFMTGKCKFNMFAIVLIKGPEEITIFDAFRVSLEAKFTLKSSLILLIDKTSDGIN
jgi:hypothetical protein